MKIINARLRHKESLYTLDLHDGVIKSITPQAAVQTADPSDIDAQQKLVIPPFVAPQGGGPSYRPANRRLSARRH